MNRKRLFWAGAIVYGILLFLLLAVWRLPAENWLPYLAEKYSKGRVTVRAERAVPSFPPGYRFEQVSYGVIEGDRSFTGRLRSLDTGMSLVRLLTGDLPFSLKAVLPGGGTVQVSALISMFRGLQKGDLDVRASGLNLEELSVLEVLSNRKIGGALSGEMSLQGNLQDPSRLSGQGRFTIQGGSVGTRMDLAGLRTVTFESIRLPFKVEGGVLTLENVEMKGPMFSGTVSGSVKLSKVVPESLLELTARLKPGPALGENPLASSLLAKVRKGKEQIVLKLGGSLQKPSMLWGNN